MEEIWKDIPNTNGQYSVSNLGRVRSNYINVTTKGKTVVVYKEKIMSQNKSGYQHCPGGYTHRVVATLFIPNPNNYNQVHHKDGDRKNNAVWNLEWVDGSEHTRNHKKGVLFTEEHKQKLSGPNPKKASYSMLGKKHSEKSKKKMSDSHKKYYKEKTKCIY